jgi:hypothetical protein
MFKGALFLALGFFVVCFSVVAQQAKHSGAKQHRAVTSAASTFEHGYTLSLYRPNVVSASSASLLFRNGPVRAWSDGAQLASEGALAQIGMAPLGLFPVTYLAPSNVGPTFRRKASAASDSRFKNSPGDGKDLANEIMSQPGNRVYYTGEVGFLYGQSIGKGGGDYWESYVWGQAGNDHFQITAGAAFENWSGSGAKFRVYPYSR